jgi:hypothetical protein
MAFVLVMPTEYTRSAAQVNRFTGATECSRVEVELHRDQPVGHVPLTVAD